MPYCPHTRIVLGVGTRHEEGRQGGKSVAEGAGIGVRAECRVLKVLHTPVLLGWNKAQSTRKAGKGKRAT